MSGERPSVLPQLASSSSLTLFTVASMLQNVQVNRCGQGEPLGSCRILISLVLGFFRSGPNVVAISARYEHIANRSWMILAMTNPSKERGHYTYIDVITA
jgi:hypothetical protein